MDYKKMREYSHEEFVELVKNLNESKLKGDTEIKRLKFFNIEEVLENLMDADLINVYKKYIKE